MVKLINGNNLDQDCLYVITDKNGKLYNIQYETGRNTDYLINYPNNVDISGDLCFIDIRYLVLHAKSNDGSYWIRKASLDRDERALRVLIRLCELR